MTRARRAVRIFFIAAGSPGSSDASQGLDGADLHGAARGDEAGEDPRDDEDPQRGHGALERNIGVAEELGGGRGDERGDPLDHRDAGDEPEVAREAGEDERLHDDLEADRPRGGADGATDPDLVRPLAHDDEHDVADPDDPGRQRADPDDPDEGPDPEEEA